MSRALLAVLALAGCFRGGGVVESATVENVAPKPATFRIARVAPRIGSVRVESSVRRGGGEDLRKVTRVVVLAVDGFASVKEKITYLEATGEKAALAGKSFVITRVDDQIEVVPVDGTPPGDEELVRADNTSFGEIDATTLMVTERDFVVDKQVKVPAPRELRSDTPVFLTLRTFDAETATFDLALKLPDGGLPISVRGKLVVERATGRDRSALVTMTIQEGRTTRETTLELQATTE